MSTPAERDRNHRLEPAASAGILSYYRAVQETLLLHVRNRPLVGFGLHGPESWTGTVTDHAVVLHVADVADIDEAVRSGIVGFRLPELTGPSLLALRLRAGAGSGVDTVATAALALIESMAHDGLATTALTDGDNGLYLIAYRVGAARGSASASGYAATLALLAPEIATTDLDDFEGRALIEPLADNGFGIPAPYSMVPIGKDLGVIVPLTLDEVAAASAGMPLEIGTLEVAGRIAGFGDLAAALIEATVPRA